MYSSALYLYAGNHSEGAAFCSRLKSVLPAESTVTVEGPFLGLGELGRSGGYTPLKLNTGAQRFGGFTRQQKCQRLQISGLKAASYRREELLGRNIPKGEQGKGNPEIWTGDFQRCYEVTVFHLQAVFILELSKGRQGVNRGEGEWAVFETAGPEPDSRLYRRLEKMAVRAVYALGLDFGEVTLTASNGAFAVSRVSPLPRLRRREAAAAFAEAAVKTAAEWAEAAGKAAAQELKIGMDPEFLLVDETRGKVIPASRYLGREGIAGCDAVWIGGRPRFPLAELRPGPAATPREALRRLMGALREADRQVADKSLSWLAGGQPAPGLPLGGHLHFSGVPLTGRLLRAFDSYLALPVAMLEPAGSRARRPRYGRLGDFRRQSHGGFEYRTLPSFLVSPAIAKGVVALAVLIAEESGRLPEERLPLEGTAELAAFYAGERDGLKKAALQAVREVESWSGYARHQAYIEPLFTAVRSGRIWDESRDIRQVWGLASSSAVPDNSLDRSGV